MAHECPVCGITCYCGGDIDDCCFSFPDDVDKCSHCHDDDDDGKWFEDPDIGDKG